MGVGFEKYEREESPSWTMRMESSITLYDEVIKMILRFRVEIYRLDFVHGSTGQNKLAQTHKEKMFVLW
ncbi:hypothetical protein AKJ16_DCAP19700 [Drosera capensis]